MAVYYKFKSAKDYDSVAIDGNFISVGHLKEKIFELKHLGRGTDFDLVVTNAQTNEEYLDEGTLIPKNTSVLIRRVPGRPRNPIITAPVAEQEEAKVENYSDDLQTVKINFGGAAQSSMKHAEDLEWDDDFGNDLYAIPETVPVQLNKTVQNPPPPVSKEDEDSKIKALIDTPALDWQRQPADSFGPGRGFGRGMGGRTMGGRGFGRGGLEKKIPPQGYICHRCKVPGHFIQHCPTNGDPNYDIKRVKPPTGIPKSMLMATPDGSYALPSGAVAVLKPNEAAFEKQIEGMPSLRTVGDFPPELHCPLCKEVMKDAVLTSKCCFKSFCDKCIRDHIISKSSCICGAMNILADDLLPNKTLRDTINRILEANNSSAEDGGSVFQIQDMESRNPQAKVPSPTQSAASKGELVPAPQPQKEESSKIVDLVVEDKAVNASPSTQMQEKGKSLKVPDVSEATHDSKSVKETALPANTQLTDEEVQQKLVSVEAGKKKKKKKIQMPPSAAEMQWRTAQDHAPDNYMMPLGPSAFNPYWNGIQPGFDGFGPPYTGPMPYMGYGFGPMDMAFGGVFPQDPFGGGQGCMLPYAPPQMDLAELAMGFNAGPPPPAMSREEFEARKANLKRKREMERHRDMELSKDREYGREASSSSVDLPKMRSQSVCIFISLLLLVYYFCANDAGTFYDQPFSFSEIMLSRITVNFEREFSVSHFPIGLPPKEHDRLKSFPVSFNCLCNSLFSSMLLQVILKFLHVDCRFNLHEQYFLLSFFWGFEIFTSFGFVPPNPCQSASFFYKNLHCNEVQHPVFPILCSKIVFHAYGYDLVQKNGGFSAYG